MKLPPYLKEKKEHGHPGLAVAVYTEPNEAETMNFPMHWHEGFEVVKISQGEVRFEVNGHKFLAQEGDMVVVATGALHSAHTTKLRKGACETVIFDLACLESVSMDQATLGYIEPLQKDQVVFKAHIKKDHVAYVNLAKIHGDLVKLMGDQGVAYELQVKAKLFDLMACLFSHDDLMVVNKRNNYEGELTIIKKVVAYILDNYAGPITVGELAGLTPYTEDYFIRYFKKYIHETPMNYVIACRLDHGRQALISSQAKVTEIAFACGFNQVSYFIKKFKARYGLSPQVYRQTYGNKEAYNHD